MFPPLTDFAALLGINLVFCAVVLHVLGRCGPMRWGKSVVAICFVMLWIPVGEARIPLVAYVRGISSDLSVTLVLLASLGLCRRLGGWQGFDKKENQAVSAVLAVTAVLFYPPALGLGDWDAYRLGWASFGMLAGLLLVALFSWFLGLRLLPLLIAVALLAWVGGLLESGNLWDYLIDPWLAIGAIFQSTKAGRAVLLGRFWQGRPADPLVATSSGPTRPGAGIS